ncbi:hypothetical protein HMF8227_00272 [Saliniradius amylolyticus]|uniref:MSHA biogenesis protein MshI n=1 Tax=Saliniradius amylolyticus TaxID=2183582 RepID=A0A2S2E0H0_9ALTE|nr:PilN domain-containing protein [Saliniradius amylolyticus]AWL10780.1 hypothetical protein HMF8227_00272 [Saliniradius amylolyticus]
MKYRVNLYPNDLKPKVELYTLQFALVLLGFCLLLVVAGSLLVQARTEHWQEQAQQASREVQQFQKILAKQRQELQQGPSPELVDQVRRMQEQAREQRLLLRQLDTLEGQQNLGLAGLMEDLAAADHPQLWLSRISVSGSDLYLQGQLSRASALPEWLEQLAQQPSLQGRDFTDARLYQQQEKGLHFVLNTGLDPKASVGGKP